MEIELFERNGTHVGTAIVPSGPFPVIVVMSGRYFHLDAGRYVEATLVTAQLRT